MERENLIKKDKKIRFLPIKFGIFNAIFYQATPNGYLLQSAIKQDDNEYQVTAFSNTFVGRNTLENKVDKKPKKLVQRVLNRKIRVNIGWV